MTEQAKAALTIAEVAEILRISPIKAYQMARQNEFPVIKIGRSVRVPAEAFYRWFNNSGCNQKIEKGDAKQ